MVTNAPPPGDYTYNNYGYGNSPPGYGATPGGPPTYSSSWNNAPNLFTNGSFGNSPYGSPPGGYGPIQGPSIFTQVPPGYGSQYPGQGEYGSFNVGYASKSYASGTGNASPGPGDYGPGEGDYEYEEEEEYSPTPGGTPPSEGEEEYTPTPGDTTTPPPADTTTPTPPAGAPSAGTGSDYVDMMMTALKKNGAGPELLDAYMKQYIALGMVPAGTAVPGGGDDDSTTPGVTPTPGTPPASGPTPPPPTGGTPPATGPTPPPPVSGPVPAGEAGDKAALKANKDMWTVTVPSAKNGAESPEFTNAGPINWDKAPAALQALKPQIEAASKASGTPESIVAAVLWSESRGKLDVTATDGGSDQGLMQIDNDTYRTTVAGKNGLPATATTPTDKDTNILAGATYLKQLKEKFGSWDVALRAYNSGEYAGTDRNDPDATPAGRGIPAYIQFARAHILDLQDGTLDANG